MRINMKNIRGFTLIELMVVIVIIGLLATFAIPNYMESVSKSRRAQASAALSSLAGVMERWRTEHGSYCDAAQTDAPSSVISVKTGTLECGSQETRLADTGPPRFFDPFVPELENNDNNDAFYALEISKATMNTFELKATPLGAMLGDKCGTFVLTHAGEKSIEGGETGYTVDNCW